MQEIEAGTARKEESRNIGQKQCQKNELQLKLNLAKDIEDKKKAAFTSTLRVKEGTGKI